jgi:hypothetical protein
VHRGGGGRAGCPRLHVFPTERWRDELKKCGKPHPIRTLSVADLRSSSTPGIESLSGRFSSFFCQFARIAYMQKLRFDLTDDVRVHTYQPASLGQVRKFDTEIAPP